MFHKIENEKDFKSFKRTWRKVCKKQKWHNDAYSPVGVKYNLTQSMSSRFPFRKRDKTIGTIEFIPYFPKNPYSSVDGPDRYSFSTLPAIQKNQGRVWEIDKLCLATEYQRKGYFENFFFVFEDHINTYQPKFYIALMEKKFYRMMRMMFGLAIEGKKEFIGQANSLIAVIFDVEKLMYDTKKVETIKKMAGIKGRASNEGMGKKQY